jgi:hypothetical protein
MRGERDAAGGTDMSTAIYARTPTEPGRGA